MKMIATRYQANEYGYVFTFSCTGQSYWTTDRRKQSDPIVPGYTEVLTVEGWKAIQWSFECDVQYGTLEEIEALVVESCSNDCYNHVPAKPAFTVQATYKTTGKLKPRKFPTEE